MLQPFQPQMQPQRLSDQVAAGVCLEACKYMALRYTIAAAESASPNIRHTLADAARDNLNMAEDMYKWLHQRQMYPVPEAPRQLIQQAQQQFAPIGAPAY